MGIRLKLTPPSCSSFFSGANAPRAFKDQLDRIYHLSLPDPPSRHVGVGMGMGRHGIHGTFGGSRLGSSHVSVMAHSNLYPPWPAAAAAALQ